MKQIICISHEPWSSFPTRTQQLITRLKDTQVLFFEPSGEQRNKHWEKGRRVRPGVTLYTLPPALPHSASRPLLAALNQRRLAGYIEKTAQRHRFVKPLLWTTSPEHYLLLEHLSYGALLYDCDRDWPEFPIEWESELTLACDLVFAASEGLANHLSPCNGNIALIPNGGNHPMFSQPKPPRPAAMRRLSAPILAWAGDIAPDLDLSPLLYAAQAHPGWNFLLLGRAEANPFLARCTACANVTLLSPDSLVDLPDYLAHCDLCLNLLRERDYGLDIIPSRLYEYLSTGKPVVSMLWPNQVEHFPDVVYGANSSEEFCRLCEKALDEPSGWVSARRQAYGERAAWSHRAAEVSRILETGGLY